MVVTTYLSPRHYLNYEQVYTQSGYIGWCYIRWCSTLGGCTLVGDTFVGTILHIRWSRNMDDMQATLPARQLSWACMTPLSTQL